MYPGVFAEQDPDRPACIATDSGEVVTFAELEERSNQGAQLFRQLGLREGDCIALYMENNARFMEICWAAQRSGLFYTCIATHLTAPEVAYIVADCDARLLITSVAKAAVATELLELLPSSLELFMVGESTESYSSWEQAAGTQPTQRIAGETEGHDFLYSSGTTGRPKGVRIALKGVPLGEDTEFFSKLKAISGNPSEGDLMYSPAPLYHAAPLRFCMTMHRVGGGCVLPTKFDAQESLRLIEQHRCTHSLWVPTMFVRMLKLPEDLRRQYDISSLQAAIHGAAPCPIEVKRAMIDWFGPVLLEYYGGSEGNGLCLIDSHETLERPGSVGRGVLGEVRILDEDQQEVEPGVDGTVYFAEGFEFEYYKDPDKTDQSRSRQGWTTLGDIGHVDEDGYLYLTDRKAFMIITGGVNVYPQEVENRLITHPAVLDVAVFGIPDEDFGETVKAVVQPMDFEQAGPELEQTLVAYCREVLSSVKCPRSIDFDRALPREANGKLYKRLLKDRYAGQVTRIVE